MCFIQKCLNMKNFMKLLTSTWLMSLVLLGFAVSIAIATFIENDFGTPTARSVVYNSWWFSSLLFIGMANLLAVILVKKLYKKEKLSMFIFHLAFLVILIGAAITRYFAQEGYVHIREGESSNSMISSDVFFSLAANSQGQIAYVDKKVSYSALSDNYQKLSLEIGSQYVSAECLKIVPNAEQVMVSDSTGTACLELVVASQTGRESYLLTDHEKVQIGDLVFSMNQRDNENGVNIRTTDSGLFITSAIGAGVNRMMIKQMDTLKPHSSEPFSLLTLYSFNGMNIVAKNFNAKARIDIQSSNDASKNNLPNALQLRIKTNDQIKIVNLFTYPNSLNKPLNISLNNLDIQVNYGSKNIEIPFSLTLIQFIVKRYPGSNSPSWFESKISLSDSNHNVQSEYRVYMNNVLSYSGYRFYQSSYDTDEKGTILSVNNDYLGTIVSYLGYLLLAFGMLWSLLNKNSRFRKLSTELNKIRASRKVAIAITAFLLLSFGNPVAQAENTLPDSIIIEKGQAQLFGQLLVQDQGGRIKPLNSLSSEVLRKISRETILLNQNSDQVLMGMVIFPEYWQNVPMVRVSHPEIQKILNIKGVFASFRDFINQASVKHEYLLSQYVDEAYRKKPAERGKFDNEIIKVDERVNLCYLIYSEQLLRIFPLPGDIKNTWYNQNDAFGKFSGADSSFVSNIMPIYGKVVREACVSHNWAMVSEVNTALSNFQQKYGEAVIPSTFKVKAEVIYNKINVFDRLASFYGLVGFVLLLFQFISVFKPKINLKFPVKISTILLVVAFLVHLVGLIARWYISGHAPWSNAYESLIYIAFATVLAGILFAPKSGIALSASALIAWLILFVAHLSWMDPEITNLVPVLKSYWLLIHVAIITASYGFLAMGALLALINLVLMGFRNVRNTMRISETLLELTIIIEMALIIGLYMLTIGTFLGGVWANESWGRYWGWDAKETWALVSVLIYAFVAHMRMIPGLKSIYTFNLMALLAFGSIIMTYFGVNYYLSGMHSYAKGDPIPVPMFVYYTIAIVCVVAFWAWLKQRKILLPAEK
jgi:cytochrome c-type biogenesis protein CcsB